MINRIENVAFGKWCKSAVFKTTNLYKYPLQIRAEEMVSIILVGEEPVIKDIRSPRVQMLADKKNQTQNDPLTWFEQPSKQQIRFSALAVRKQDLKNKQALIKYV